MRPTETVSVETGRAQEDRGLFALQLLHQTHG
jgi:hypothetical protein